MEGPNIFVGKYIKPVDSEKLGGHHQGGLFVNIIGDVALRSSAVFRAGGEEKLLVLITCHNPIGMVLIGGD